MEGREEKRKKLQRKVVALCVCFLFLFRFSSFFFFFLFRTLSICFSLLFKVSGAFGSTSTPTIPVVVLYPAPASVFSWLRTSSLPRRQKRESTPLTGPLARFAMVAVVSSLFFSSASFFSEFQISFLNSYLRVREKQRREAKTSSFANQWQRQKL